MNLKVKKFLSYYKPYRGLFASVMLTALLVSAATLLFPLCTRYITKTVLAGDLTHALDPIYRTGAGMLLLIAINTLGTYYYDYRGHAMGAMMERDMRRELFEHLEKLPFAFFDGQKTGQLMSRLTNDLLSLAELYHHGPEDLAIYSVRFVGAFAILFTIDPRLTLTIFAFLPALAVFSLHFNRRLHATMKDNKERIADVNTQVEDSLAGIRVVKSFTNEETEQARFAVENNRFLESRKSTYRNEAFFFEGIQAFTDLITVTVIVLGGVSIVHATLDLADLITFMMYVSSLTEPVQRLIYVTRQYQEGITGFERFLEILQVQPEAYNAPDASALTTVLGRIEFRDVAFRYRQDHNDVLKHLSFVIQPGEYIALVGSSGVGKTTLCSLIPRFYEVNEGTILLDGLDTRAIRLSALRQQVGIVQQDVYLFAGTVLENIRYGKPGASQEEIIAAARAANAHEFITALPNGYHTDVGQRGVRLSGGQKQRLSIARVFLKDPPILVFDEATSSLDNESEKVVQESLEKLAHNRTTLVIAHRLSTVRNATRILVLTDQGIFEQGTHTQLMQAGGLYARLYNAQASERLSNETLLS